MLVLPEPASGARRLDFVERVLTKDVTSALVRELPPPAAGYIWLGLARLALGRLAQPGDLQTVLRGLPHNVTTEMDLDLWRTASVIREDPQSVRTLTRKTPSYWPAAILRAFCPPSAKANCALSSPPMGTAPWPRSTLASPDGPRTRPTSSTSWPTI